MKKIFTVIAALSLFATGAWADEGMWLPALISQRIGDMQAKGFKLSAEDVYSINQASLKDAVVLFGGGCTGEIVSDQGLLFTNHHCGYSNIQKHSSVEHDYLRDGFWAMNRSEELPNPGLRVSFLQRMEDVTSIILKGYDPAKMNEAQRDSIVRANSAALRAEAVKEGKGLRASVEGLFYGNQYFLFIFKDYRDVRLVGAPPSSIGKFGGDTDNWMWPRHTGDFSIFRVYAGKDNEPADYSKDNVPYTPKKSFTISRKGVQEGDFTFIYGCPGSTQEYIHSDAVNLISEVSDPQKIALRTMRLDAMNKYMEASQAVRIQYSSKYANVSNSWKKWQGEAKGIRRNDIVAKKKAYEEGLAKWAKGGEFDGIVEKLASLYAEIKPFAIARDLYNESAATVELAQFTLSYERTRRGTMEEKKAAVDAFFKDYYAPIDKDAFVAVMKEFAEKSKGGLKPDNFDAKLASYGSIEAWAEDIFTNSLYLDREKVLALGEEDTDEVRNDPAYTFARDFLFWYSGDVTPDYNRINSEIALLNRDYMRAQMEYSKDKEFYPDANLTLRVAYGKVAGYEPYDGAYYHPVSTLTGIMEKDNPNIFDYNIPQKLRDIYAAGGVEDQPVCFLATNHTTGGNSGSPVINADGNLIGINFDRVWEGTMSDIAFDPSFCRNISLDVRYLLFVIDRIGGASYLFDEMKFDD